MNVMTHKFLIHAIKEPCKKISAIERRVCFPPFVKSKILQYVYLNLRIKSSTLTNDKLQVSKEFEINFILCQYYL